ncbi:uncharacterized protein CG45078 isoform X1 [Scaptodrosophila lebanonensis]|uniref:Uncharacterized protein CG45078 isoform X1 n=1 Tax=Drosophila lebanonensis TaxID=7225 RepID=A0A6J2U062_DROLE|nr:uncharacterized protein CG45078 isoform X1 [Scaptodrosophila lebanonensis]
MVYENGFTTRRSYSSRPVTTSYAVTKTNRTPIDWEKVPFVPRASLVPNPVTAFGIQRRDQDQRKPSILIPANQAAIRPNNKILHQPIDPYVSTRDKNRSRIRGLIREHIDTQEMDANRAARTSRVNIDAFFYLQRAALNNLPVQRETYRNERSGAVVSKYYY